jgi:hypothetical protein
MQGCRDNRVVTATQIRDASLPSVAGSASTNPGDPTGAATTLHTLPDGVALVPGAASEIAR